jgi:hypothetical protein
MSNHEVNFTAQDILAAIGFEAQRVAAGVSQHAAGAPFPDPKIIQQVLDRMTHLNKTLLQFGALLYTKPTEINAEGGMGVILDN